MEHKRTMQKSPPVPKNDTVTDRVLQGIFEVGSPSNREMLLDIIPSHRM